MREYRSLPWLVMGVVLLAGCTGYGRLERISRSDEKITIENLVAHVGEYDVYYSGYDLDNASGIIFDPKNDFRKLVPSDRWRPVVGETAVADLVSWIQVQSSLGYFPTLHRIRGPAGEFYGYLYSGWNDLITKVIGENSLLVYDLPDPPHYRGPNPDFEDEGF